MALPLAGVNVLDLTNIMAGPYCTMVLGDMGAEVVKVENFPEGDASRRFDPKVNDESYCFAVLNRNKKSLALDMKHPRGKEIFRQLAAKADIITENFRPGVIRKLGIDYDSVRQFNPGVVYASMSGFGQTGPYGRKGGYDEIMRDAHIKARKMVVDMDHPVIGPMKTLGMPIKSTGELTAIRKPAPWLGQHSAEVLRSLGCDSADIDALFSEGVVYDKFRDQARDPA